MRGGGWGVVVRRGGALLEANCLIYCTQVKDLQSTVAFVRMGPGM